MVKWFSINEFNSLNYWWLSISPLTYKTKYFAPQTIKNRLSNPWGGFEGAFAEIIY